MLRVFDKLAKKDSTKTAEAKEEEKTISAIKYTYEPHDPWRRGSNQITEIIISSYNVGINSRRGAFRLQKDAVLPQIRETIMLTQSLVNEIVTSAVLNEQALLVASKLSSNQEYADSLEPTVNNVAPRANRPGTS